ncbi:MAG: hypothetical protein ABI693_30430, partial [Bryobacteraceae bacterium]
MSTYVDGTTPYAPFGGLTQMTLGAVAKTRADNSRLQLTSLIAGAGATTPLTLGFGYSATQNNGNLSSQTINHAGTVFTQNYTGYDGANRLTAASEGANWAQSYAY